MKENELVKKCMMFLRDKHLYSIDTLNQILAKTEADKSNKEGDLKCLCYQIKWCIVILMTLLNTITKVFELVKKNEEKTTTST